MITVIIHTIFLLFVLQKYEMCGVLTRMKDKRMDVSSKYLEEKRSAGGRKVSLGNLYKIGDKLLANGSKQCQYTVNTVTKLFNSQTKKFQFICSVITLQEDLTLMNYFKCLCTNV